MGYRNYIYVVDKARAEEVRHRSFEELRRLSDEEDDYFGYMSIRDVVGGQCAMELGKYVDFDIKPYIKTFFTNKDVHTRVNQEEEFMLLDPSALPALATFYKNKTMDFWKEKLKAYEKDKDVGGAVLYKDLEHRVAYAQNLDEISENKFCLCDTWLWDYDLLNFVYLAKTVDFDKYYLIWMGW